MKLFIAILFLILLSKQSFCQPEPCTCNATVNLSFPHADNAMSGKVIVEWDVDSLGFYSNAVVVQSLRKEYDDEALKKVKELIRLENICRRRCKIPAAYPPGKRRLPIVFSSAEDE